MEDKEHLAPGIVQKYIDMYYKLNGPEADRQSKEALKWFARRIGKDTNPNRDSLLNQNIYAKRTGNENLIPGRLFYFKYKAEIAGNKQLGIYDQYPMVFFFNSSKNKEGQRVLHGINVHYLNTMQRYSLFLNLMKIKSTGKDEKRKLQLQWDMIKAVAGTKIAEHCVHAYRVDRLQSRLIQIHPDDWAIATFLQLQKWQKPSGDHILQSHGRKSIRNVARKL